MQNCQTFAAWVQLLKNEDLPLFIAFHDTNLNVFGFWSGGRKSKHFEYVILGRAILGFISLLIEYFGILVGQNKQSEDSILSSEISPSWVDYEKMDHWVQI